LDRYAIIENEQVVNVIVADSEFIKEHKINGVSCAEEVYAGWKYIDKEFVAPEPNYVPEIIDEAIPGAVENVEE
jgi:hypothetical protein